MQIRFDSEKKNGRTAVTLLDSTITDDDDIQEIGNQLFELADQKGNADIELCFRNVKLLSSAFIGKLHALRMRLVSQKGSLVLSEVSPDIKQMLSFTRVISEYTFLPDDEAPEFD